VPARWPIGIRTAVAAGLIALVLLGGGALWLRSTIVGIDRDREAARVEGGQAVVTALKDTLRAGKPPPVLKEAPYELIGSSGGYVPATNPDVRALETALDGPIVDQPLPGGPSGPRVVTVGGIAMTTEYRTSEWPRWTAVTEVVPTPPAMVADYGPSLKIAAFVTRPDESPLPDLDPVLWFGVPGAALLIALVAWLATAHALRPVEYIRRQTGAITATDLNRRVLLPRKWLRSWSVGRRAAVAAGLIAAVPFVVGALWLRHGVETANTARMMANANASLSATEATGTVVRERLNPNPFPALDQVLLPGVPAAILLVGFTAWAATTRALVPVEKIRRRTADISTHALNLRVPVPPTRDVISRLAVTLNETLDRLEKAVDTQRSFIADAAHELRSPVASLRTVLEVAADHPETADWPAVVSDAVLDTRRLERLTEDLLLLANLDSAQPLRLTKVDLTELVRNLVPSGVRLHTNGSALVRGNPDQLGRLLRNLVDNAQRHAASETVVAVRTTPFVVRLEVSDDGPGIPAEDRERVFVRFHRLDEARDSDSGGTGLGLAIAREIAQAHSGDLRVAATESGTRFVAEFPRLPDD
jgi:signal transduction histidine kinase